MDTREHARIQLPFEVEVTHPSAGLQRSIARDISESGMYVAMATDGLRVGSKVKLRVIVSTLTEGSPTPTVEMEVVRLDAEGVGLKFSNRTSHHLWQSVVRQREELAVGRDYFQVFQAAVIVNPQRKLLVVQEHGRWLFPGCYLMVGEAWLEVLKNALRESLGLDDVRFRDTLEVDSGTDIVAAERAMLSLFHRFSCDVSRAKPAPGGRYTKVKWIGRTTGLEDLTFSHPLLRGVAQRALDRADAEFEEPAQGQRLPNRR